MAGCGTLRSEKDRFVGKLRTLTLSLAIELTPVEEKRGDGSPDFDVWGNVPGGEPAPIGSAWKKTAERNGTRFLSITVDDPSFPAPLNLAAFERDGGGFEIVWNRPRQQGRDAA